MIRNTLSSIIALSAAATVFAPEGLGVAAEENEIARITHLPIEEVDARLETLSTFFGVSKEEVTERFYQDAVNGDLPTAEEEQQEQQQEEELLDSLLADSED
jgi:hypothetical protein